MMERVALSAGRCGSECVEYSIIMAMAAIGLNSNVIQLIKTGGKPIAVGATCWCGITIVSLIMQHVMHIW